MPTVGQPMDGIISMTDCGKMRSVNMTVSADRTVYKYLNIYYTRYLSNLSNLLPGMAHGLAQHIPPSFLMPIIQGKIRLSLHMYEFHYSFIFLVTYSM